MATASFATSPSGIRARIEFLDDARALAMLCVFLAHTLEQFNIAGFHSTFPVWQLICAVTVPLFFFVAGLVARPDNGPVGEMLINRCRRCFLPVIFFSVMMLPAWVLHGKSSGDLLAMAKFYLYGSPQFHWIMWFMVAMFWMELFAAALFAMFGARHALSWLWCALFLLAGYTITPAIIDFNVRHGLPRETWFLGEAIVGAGFYFAGHAAKPLLLQLPRNPLVALLGVACIGAAFYCAPRIDVPMFKVVVISFSVLGNYHWFVITAFFSITGTLLLARMLPAHIKPLQFVGRNTLIFVGMNGFNLHFLDALFAQSLKGMTDSILVMLPIALGYNILMCVLYTPVVITLKRYCSPLMGMRR